MDTTEPEPEVDIKEVAKNIKETDKEIKEINEKLMQMFGELTIEDEETKAAFDEFVKVFGEV